MCGLREDAQVGQAELHAMEMNATLQFEEDIAKLALQEREGTRTPSAENQTSADASSHLNDLLPGINLGMEIEQPSPAPPPQPREDMLCVVCMEREKKVFLLPCRHICMCKVCTDEIIAGSAQCPVCREHVENSFEAFF